MIGSDVERLTLKVEEAARLLGIPTDRFLEWLEDPTSREVLAAGRELKRRQRLDWTSPAPSRSPFGPRARSWTVNVGLIDRERVLRGWTQRELARRARVDQGTLCDLLALRRRPTFGTVQAICTALDLTLDQVIAFPPTEAR